MKPLNEWFLIGGTFVNKKCEYLTTQIETLKNIRNEIGLNRREFSDYMGIPLRTLEEWESGRRKMPDYLLRLITYQVKMEQFLSKNGIKYEECNDGRN